MLTLSVGTQALADPCHDALDAADKYINACDDTLSKYRALTADQDKLILKLTEQRDELAGKKDPMPWYYWVIIGAGSYAIIDTIRR